MRTRLKVCCISSVEEAPESLEMLVKVGTTEAELRDAYPGARCRTESSAFRHCWRGRFRPGRRVTGYRIGIDSGLVKNVLVAFVID